ncbi:DsbA family protein [Streptomyces sp. DG2A-72]|uniref:mycothiol-dependent nitroreductase Rv2466c family protein n=1 Tax=Streptomyces sp. DG2A-72 TaxID=3051386 RepID=UPI00265C1C26|nr:DsbA family protein [Streptomyces sp. DG2A-72]MDO0937304.1 DsbA family protein [Streptomyces sp. DG2A-72]
MSTTPVDFWFDPLCPWTWTTSRWLLEVAGQRDLEIHWQVMSLAVLNEGRLDQIPEEFHELLGPKGLRPVRVLAAVGQKSGTEAVGRLYTELGIRFHERGRTPDLDTITEALSAAGLPADLVSHADSEAYDVEVRASHQRGQDQVGEESGSPIIGVPGASGDRVAFFGPIVTPIPRGETAVRLWDATLLAASVPGFAELKRARAGEKP